MPVKVSANSPGYMGPTGLDFNKVIWSIVVMQATNGKLIGFLPQLKAAA